MTEHRTGATLRRVLAHWQQRQRTRGLLRGIAAALAVAAMAVAVTAVAALGMLGRSVTASLPLMPVLGASLALGMLGALVGWWHSARSDAQSARALDTRVPAARNLLVTAQELLATRADVSNLSATDLSATDLSATEVSATEALVLHRADQLAATLDIQALAPYDRERRWLLWAGAGWLLMLLVTRDLAAARWLRTTLVRTERRVAARVTGDPTIISLRATVVPPAYTGRAASVQDDPARLELLAFSTVRLQLQAMADSLRITQPESGGDPSHGDPSHGDTPRGDITRTIGPAPDGSFTVTVRATRDGYVALEPVGRQGAVGVRRVIGLSVRPDDAPLVRVVAPARDLLVTDSTHTIGVTIEATDDLGLTALRLSYTTVSGSGERFTFADGSAPLQLTRTSATRWRGQATLALDSLLREAGDVVVVRGVARDARPGAAAVESDAVLIERVSPGGLAATGFSTDPDEDRSALSQQMVILKTERLIASRRTQSAEAVASEAQQLATEQRRVRAEFVFMMGGEFAQESQADESGGDLNEAAETEAESDLAAGRMVNRGRIALMQAVRAMSRAAVALTAGELTAALAREKEALVQLQEAFSRSRFLMRALSQREQLDPTRRLSGRLDSLATSREPMPEGDRVATRIALRAVLAELLTTSAAPRSTVTGSGTAVGTAERARLAGLAARVLAADPSSPAAQAVAQALTVASQGGARAAAARNAAAAGLTQLLGAGLPPAPNGDAPPGWRALRGGRP